ncbi:thioredoxin-like 1-2, chloroplastic [Pyrus x bretschneideri]|uniref:thioredoxin-like 1-2, chloroplastic n=1 Tax=Pyrus x bretschneideri TaxID=225117 RepID=UPI00202E5551|nr:thioredoxin-like 1-2, chloroplastic [Pyrus x bretschneideri]
MANAFASQTGFCISSGLDEIAAGSKSPKGDFRVSPTSQFKDANSRAFPALSVDFLGKPLILSDQGFENWRVRKPSNFSVHAQASLCVSRAMRWWEKTLHPNMVEIHSAQELVDSLKNAGDRLVVVDFYSPGCGGCRALHPKICQLAESNPNAIFLKVNYEEHKTMCHALNIHVLPFFRFFRGADGRVCSFSCTNATIKKFKDALAKHGSDRCNLGPAKGLDESEIIKLASIGEILTTTSSPSTKEERLEDLVTKSVDFSGVWSNEGHIIELEEEGSMVKV